MDLRMLIPIFGIVLVMIPVAGLTFVLTLRLAVKPFVETLANALRDSRYGPGADRLTSQLVMLAEEVETLGHEVRGLRNAQDFDSALMERRDEPIPAGLGASAKAPV